MAVWRAMRAEDLEQVGRLADLIHPGLPEGDEIYAERLRLFPEGLIVLAEGEAILGYGVSHPIRPASPPALDSLLGEIAADASDYYIHDVAVAPEMRGGGYARQGIEALLDIGRRYRQIALISVYGTSDFWGRFGFEVDQSISAEKLQAYGETAVFMVKRPDEISLAA